MLEVPPARSRGRTRRALLAAALPAALAMVVLPSAADAASVRATPDAVFVDGGSEANNVTVRVDGDHIVVSDTAGVALPGGTCGRTSTATVRCSRFVDSITVNVGGGDDSVEYRARHAGTVHLGTGVNAVFGGRRESSGQSIEPVNYFGHAGHDRIDFSRADRGVRVTPEDGLANDGRPGDRENVHVTFDEFIGSDHADVPLFGTADTDLIDGRGGNDQMGGGGGNDVFLPRPGDGADDYHGGPGIDSMEYLHLGAALDVSLDNLADDGVTGEGDNVRSNVENLFGGAGDDTFSSLGAHSTLDGRRGNDTLLGGAGPDTLVGGPERDTLNAGTENDVVFADDGESDGLITCGLGEDTARVDTLDDTSGCENRPVGVLRLAPETIRADAGEPVRMRVSWRHPKAWKQLRSIALRLTDDGRPVGEVMIDPGREQVRAGGAVRLARRATQLGHKDKTVTAQLALRLPASLGGRTLQADVEAVDARGRRQLERAVATIRVAP